MNNNINGNFDDNPWSGTFFNWHKSVHFLFFQCHLYHSFQLYIYYINFSSEWIISMVLNFNILLFLQVSERKNFSILSEQWNNFSENSNNRLWHTFTDRSRTLTSFMAKLIIFCLWNSNSNKVRENLQILLIIINSFSKNITIDHFH